MPAQSAYDHITISDQRRKSSVLVRLHLETRAAKRLHSVKRKRELTRTEKAAARTVSSGSASAAHSEKMTASTVRPPGASDERTPRAYVDADADADSRHADAEAL